ncbi:MAG: reverse transcriptase domain-containing protein [Pseudomonadota bacterium]
MAWDNVGENAPWVNEAISNQIVASKRLALASIGKAAAVFGEDWTPQNREWVKRSAFTYARELTSLAKATASTSKERRDLTRRVLQSSAGRTCVLIHAASKRGLTLTRSGLEKLSSEIWPWKDCGEAVRVCLKEKPDGTHRPTVDLGVRRLALSYLAGHVLRAIWGVAPDEFNRRGKGTHAAVGFLMRAIENDRPWAFTADVKDFYPSIRHEVVKKFVPLPENVISNCILIPEGVKLIVPPGYGDSEATRDTLRRGIPQGSPTSDLVASQLLGMLLEPIAFDTMCARYSDNIFGACDTREDAEATLLALSERLRTHPAGELTLHKQTVTHSDKGVHLLGYLVTTNANQERYEARAFPSPSSCSRWLSELPSRLTMQSIDARQDEAIALTLEWLRCWRSSDPSCDWIDRLLTRAIVVASEPTDELS